LSAGFAREKKGTRGQFFPGVVVDAEGTAGATLCLYDHLKEDLKAELPLKRIWTTAAQEEE